MTTHKQIVAQKINAYYEYFLYFLNFLKKVARQSFIVRCRLSASSSVNIAQDLRNGVCSPIPGSTNFFPKIGDSHCDRIHSSLAADHLFGDNYVGKY